MTAALVRRIGCLLTALLTAVTLSGCGFHGLYDASLPGGANVGSNPYHVLIDFSDVLDLVPQSSVKVNDVTVGKVEKITLQDWHAQVQIVLNGNVSLPANAYARIRQTSLLGEKFVSLSYPPSNEVSDSTTLRDASHPGYAYPHIGINRTGATPEVEQVLGALSLLLNGGGIQQIKTITHELDQALSGHSQQIRSLLDQLTTFTTDLDRQKARILTAITNLDALAARLNAQKQILARALDTIPQAVKVLADSRDQFVALLGSLDRLSTVAVGVINGSTDNFVSSLKSLDPVMTELTKTGTDLPKSMEMLATFPFPKTAVNGIRGDYTNLYVTADLNLTDLLSNLLTPVPKGSTSQSAYSSPLSATIPGAGSVSQP